MSTTPYATTLFEGFLVWSELEESLSVDGEIEYGLGCDDLVGDGGIPPAPISGGPLNGLDGQVGPLEWSAAAALDCEYRDSCDSLLLAGVASTAVLDSLESPPELLPSTLPIPVPESVVSKGASRAFSWIMDWVPAAASSFPVAFPWASLRGLWDFVDTGVWC